ncbi:HK97 family phage prohead protease [Roseibium sp. CAU 1637]|uniref:HK97 family phage prohead protease n=1 Tax=Roseibium limicola TaxID=2816037 RepID=A0A939J9A9_9HYPH|nr:HK97 family phage prohead protease [Roseibium limicola]MBO0345203.1 HK97 family phage prohead protease [Roseibium limicola]
MTGAVLTGYAALFDVVDGGGDMIRPGAFARVLRNQAHRSLPMLWQHDPSRPIGRWTAVCEDHLGLRVTGHLTPGVQRSEEAARLIASGALSGLSIGFKAVRAQTGKAARRVLTEIDLWEVSLVTFPQIPGARVQLVAPPEATTQKSAQVPVARLTGRLGTYRSRRSL